MIFPVPDPDWSICTATKRDLTYIDKLQHKHSHEVGFLPKCAIQQKLEQWRYLLLRLRRQPAAYILTSGGIRKPLHTIQIAVTEELWLQGYGSLLAYATCWTAAHAPLHGLTTTIRDDLAANQFIRVLGAHEIGRRLLKPNSTRFMYDYWTTPRRIAMTVKRLRYPDGHLDERFKLINIFNP